MIGLGIESSCDETGIAIIHGGRRVLANLVYSQLSEHSEWRGVVPELASRLHLEKINYLYEEAITEAHIDPERISYVAFANRPGLVGPLLIGAQFARCFSYVYRVPIVTVDHLEAHLHAPLLEQRQPGYPFLGLLLSGGNSAIFLVHGPGQMEPLADTLDDALGEAFDKVATILDLGYPGGPEIEKAAERHLESIGPAVSATTTGLAGAGEPLFRPLLRDPNRRLTFSFSGIKTAALQARRKGVEVERVAFEFQRTVFELVERVLLQAVEKSGVRRIVAAGGVLANATLRSRLDRLAEAEQLQLVYPESRLLCTDNAAMVAALGALFYRQGIFSGLDFAVFSRREV